MIDNPFKYEDKNKNCYTNITLSQPLGFFKSNEKFDKATINHDNQTIVLQRGNFIYKIKFNLNHGSISKIKQILYHGSPEKLSIIKPKDEHGDPKMPPLIFASPSKMFALAYSGKKWGDKDIFQQVTSKNMYLLEARPNAIKDIYNTSGYLYELPSETFKSMPGRRTTYELGSSEEVVPTKIIRIPNVLKALKDEGVALILYNPKSERFRSDLIRQIRRMKEFIPKEAKQYKKWRLDNAPPEVKELWKMLEEE